LSAAHEAAAMDVLCADKTGTLTCNVITVADVVAFPPYCRDDVVAFAGHASSAADQDPIDAAIRKASEGNVDTLGQLVRFMPFDPASKMSGAVVVDSDGDERRVIKGAFEMVSQLAEVPPNARKLIDEFAGQGHRILAVATATQVQLRLAGLIVLSDPPREDSASLIAALRGMGVRTIMVTGDSAATGAAIAREVGIAGGVCPAARLCEGPSADEYGCLRASYRSRSLSW
jgi:H+-transporting ATPase